MGIYFNPVTEISKVGRQLNSCDYQSLVNELEPGELLFGVFDRLSFKCAPHLHSSGEFEEFDSQYRQGTFVSREFYAVKASDTEQYCGYAVEAT